VRDGKGDILLKGSVDTGTLLRAVLNAESGLRTGRLLSDVFLFEYPDEGGSRFIMITDGGVNLSPDIYQKLEILKNGVDVAHALGIELPRVAVLSASENVNPQLPSSVDAAVLTEMNRRGEIPGCLVEGPLALDLAVSRDAARIKGLRSEVAGRVDILLVPDIETGNAVAKATTYFAHYSLGHVIVGATAPVLIPSRSDRKEAKLFSIALGVLMSAFYGAQGVVSKAAEAAASV
jgi:phosphate butyryltransferase